MPIEYDQLGNIEGAVPGTDIYGNPTGSEETAPIGERIVPGVPPGAEPEAPEPPETTFRDIKGELTKVDMRVRILVPPKYISNFLSGPEGAIARNGGILFPYTPRVSYEAKAEYAEAKP